MNIRYAAIAALLALAPAAQASNLVQNGGFEITTNGPGQMGFNTEATGWSTNGYNFVFGPGTGDTTGSNGYYGYTALWGPNNGAANGMPSASPDGGNFVGADGDYWVAPITQQINGLVVGKTYKVAFDYGFAQQSGFSGPTIQSWEVNLGTGPSQSTANYDLPNHGFSGWLHASMNFIATDPSETLSFLAHGNLPVPPFALLDGVSVASAAPEPGTWALMLIGAGLLGAAQRRRRSVLA